MLRRLATPYVPGRTRGVLRFGAVAATPGNVVVLSQEEVAGLGADARPAGIVLMEAAPLSHVTLRLMGRGIPTVLAEAGQLAGLAEGAEVLLDGRSGLLASPVPADLPEAAVPEAPLAGQAVLSQDGVGVELRCSVGHAAGAAAARAGGAAGIGLFRSEYLFPRDGTPPDADFLAQACEAICLAAAPLPVTFRLPDIAGDKRPPWLGETPGLAGVLGLQGARLFAREPVRGVYLAQLEAIRRLGGRFPVRVLLPYVVGLAELETLLAEVRSHLPVGVAVGSMMETPAAALAVAEFLQAADFVSLGCNDLMQCLFAADRDLPELRAYLDPHAPVLYRFLALVAERAGTGLDRVQVAGLLSQLVGVLPVFLGLGYRNFSVEPVMLPWMADTVRRTDTAQAAMLARQVCEARRPDEVRRLLGLPGLPA